jgi:NAD(P)-dependent dehydrogenase (short-subunit alcohol dehydrogenase family)
MINSDNPFDLTGKLFLVTGASSGIGYETCLAINRQGGSFIAVARREDFLKKLTDDCGSGNSYVVADLSNQDDIKKLVSGIDKIDGIVHSAGIVSLAPTKFYSEELMTDIRKINFDSIVHIVNLIFKGKKINKSGSIVLVSSIASIAGMKGNGIYASSKGALNSISKVWAVEFANMKIRVNCVSPGMVKTEITAKSIENLSIEAIREDEKKYPLGYGEAAEVANPVIFLLSGASSWITGQNIILDGGRTIAI